MTSPSGEFRFRKSISSLLDSGRFADAKIECDGQVFHVHKSVVCTQSEYFSRAFDEKNGYKEANTNTIQLQEIEASTVRAIIEFMYHGDYKDLAEDDNLLLSIDVYAAAEMYQVEDLKGTATRHFKEIAPRMFDLPSFPDAIRAIYQSTMDEDRGLRDIVVDTAVRKVHDLVKDDQFNDTFITVGAFGKDLIHAMSKKIKKELEDQKVLLTDCLKCPRCYGQKWLKQVLLKTTELLRCDYCYTSFPYQDWRRN